MGNLRSRRKIQEAKDNADEKRAAELESEKAYKQGVEEKYDGKTVYVDPDKIVKSGGHPSKRHGKTETYQQTIKKQMDEQLEGSTEDLKEYYNEEKPPEEKIGAADLAKEMKQLGPAAVSVEGNKNRNEFGVVIVPDYRIDSKEKIIRVFTHHLGEEEQEKILKNMPGTSEDWARIIGNHEGEHLNTQHQGKHKDQDVLEEETRADASAMKSAESRGQNDVALALRDLRHLTAGIDNVHATGPLLQSGDKASYRHIDEAARFCKDMDYYVNQNFDWEKYEGEAKTPEELLKENPEAYFEASNKGMVRRGIDAIDEYQKNPTSMDAQKGVLSAEININYQKNFEDAYRRRILGQDVSEREYTTVLPQGKKDEILITEQLDDKISPTRSKHEFSTYADYSSDQAFEDFDWDAYGGRATSAEELLKENPEIHRETEVKYLETLKQEAVEAYEADPSYENTGKLLEMQYNINNRFVDINYERRKNLKPGEKSEILDTPTLVPGDVEREYYKERMELEDKNAKIDKEVNPARLEHWNKINDEYSEDQAFKDFDWDTYEGSATNAKDLLEENPEFHRETELNFLREAEKEAFKAYETDPSYENTGKLLEAKFILNERYQIIDSDRYEEAKKQGKDTGEWKDLKHPTPDVPNDVEHEYYKKRMELEENNIEQEKTLDTNSPADEGKTEPDNKVEVGTAVEETAVSDVVQEGDKNYVQGPNGQPYTTEVDIVKGDLKVDLQNGGTTVSDEAMNNVFASSAAPDISNISMVDASIGVTPPEMQDSVMNDDSYVMGSTQNSEHKPR